MTATVRNVGGFYNYGQMFVTLPDGATFDFQGIAMNEWGMNGCSLTGDGSQTWGCVADPPVIAASGGTATLKFRVVVNIAPRPEEMTLDGGRIEPVAFTGSQQPAIDATPGNNVHRFKLILSPS